MSSVSASPKYSAGNSPVELDYYDIRDLTDRLYGILEKRGWEQADMDNFVDRARERWEKMNPKLYKSEIEFLAGRK